MPRSRRLVIALPKEAHDGPLMEGERWACHVPAEEPLDLEWVVFDARCMKCRLLIGASYVRRRARGDVHEGIDLRTDATEDTFENPHPHFTLDQAAGAMGYHEV